MSWPGAAQLPPPADLAVGAVGIDGRDGIAGEFGDRPSVFLGRGVAAGLHVGDENPAVADVALDPFQQRRVHDRRVFVDDDAVFAGVAARSEVALVEQDPRVLGSEQVGDAPLPLAAAQDGVGVVAPGEAGEAGRAVAGEQPHLGLGGVVFADEMPERLAFREVFFNLRLPEHVADVDEIIDALGALGDPAPHEALEIGEIDGPAARLAVGREVGAAHHQRVVIVPEAGHGAGVVEDAAKVLAGALDAGRVIGGTHEDDGPVGIDLANALGVAVDDLLARPGDPVREIRPLRIQMGAEVGVFLRRAGREVGAVDEAALRQHQRYRVLAVLEGVRDFEHGPVPFLAPHGRFHDRLAVDEDQDIGGAGWVRPGVVEVPEVEPDARVGRAPFGVDVDVPAEDGRLARQVDDDLMSRRRQRRPLGIVQVRGGGGRREGGVVADLPRPRQVHGVRPPAEEGGQFGDVDLFPPAQRIRAAGVAFGEVGDGRIARLEERAETPVRVGSVIDEQVAGRMAQLAVRLQPARYGIVIGGERAHDLLHLRQLNVLGVRRAPGEDVVDPEVDDPVPGAGVLRLPLRDLFGIPVQNPARIADGEIDPDRQFHRVGLPQGPVPVGRVADPFGRADAVGRGPEHQAAVARVAGEGEIAPGIVVIVVAAVREPRPHPGSVIESEAVAVPAVEVHRDRRLGFGRQDGRVGRELPLANRGRRRAGRGGDEEHPGADADGGDAPLARDLADPQLSAARRYLLPRDARQQAEVGQKLRLKEPRLGFGFAADFKDRRRRRVGRLAQHAGDGPVAAKAHRRQLLANRQRVRPTGGRREGGRDEKGNSQDDAADARTVIVEHVYNSARLIPIHGPAAMVPLAATRPRSAWIERSAGASRLTHADSGRPQPDLEGGVTAHGGSIGIQNAERS